MNKAELTEAVVERTEWSKTEAGAAIDAVFDSIATALTSGDSVSLVGFGTFSISNRATRTGRNPRTGEAMTIPAYRTVKFKAGKALKDAVK